MAQVEIVEPREIVNASNELFRARHKIKDVLAGRIFMAFASLVDENALSEDGVFLEYKISASSILLENMGGDNYRQLKDAANSLVGHRIEKKLKKNNFAVYALFSAIKYEDGVIFGRFDKDLKPFFIEIKRKFTRLSLNQYLKLPSIYSQQLFGFLQSWHDQPEIEIPVSELHEMLDTPNSFRNDFRNFRLRVLEKSHRDITSLTSLRYEWEPIKRGRAVVAIRFIFSKKRALPVSTAKQIEAETKTSQKNNATFHAALECATQRNRCCTRQDNKPGICAVCLKLGLCEATALRLL